MNGSVGIIAHDSISVPHCGRIMVKCKLSGIATGKITLNAEIGILRIIAETKLSSLSHLFLEIS